MKVARTSCRDRPFGPCPRYDAISATSRACQDGPEYGSSTRNQRVTSAATSQPGQRQVGVKPSPANHCAGLRGGGPDPACQPHQLFPVVLHTRPQNLRVTGVREGARASQSQYQRLSSRRGALEALEQLIRMPVSHVREEGEGDVPLLGHGPAQARSRLLARLEELGQVLLDRFGQRQRDKHPHGSTS